MQEQHEEHVHPMDAQKNVGVELDLNDVESVPLTRDRLLGLQHELQDALAEEDFQNKLVECEKTLGKGTLEFRKKHQQLVLEVQSEILPKYGFAPSIQGVAEMLKQVNAFSNDKEITANIKAINALIWKPHESHHEHHATEPAHHDVDWLQRWGHHEGGAAAAPPKALPADGGFDPLHVHVGVELDLEAVPVPLSRERLLGLQEELREHFAEAAFQQKLRECEKAHGDGTMEFRKEHQRLVLEAQATVLPKYGFEGTAQGVHDLMAIIKSSYSGDAEVFGNVSAIDKLIWRSGHAPDAKAMAHKREG